MVGYDNKRAGVSSHEAKKGTSNLCCYWYWKLFSDRAKEKGEGERAVKLTLTNR